jgi:hypothetical protein
VSLPGDENPNPQWQRREEEPNPQWTSGDPLGEQSQWQSEWQRRPEPQWQQPAPPQSHEGWVPPPRTPGQAYAAMILGIIGLFPLCPVILSVIALILGFTAKNEIDRSNGQLGGSGIAMAGIVTGAIGTAFYLLIFLVVLAA